jgi:geranylgeranyl reductase family protein
MYDVIIIGAGPAGSSAAKELAGKGYNVLLVEKFKMPRNKSCSGILIKKSMDLVQKYFGGDTPDFVQCTPNDNRGMIFTNDEGQEYRYEQEGLNIWRNSFDNWLAEKAAEAGAEVRDGTAALSCEEKEDYVVVKLKDTSEYTETAKLVISCDGVVSTIKRQLLNTSKNFITTYQTFNKGTINLDYHYFYAYLQPHLSEYDAWFNVKDDYLIFGVSVKDTDKIAHFYSEFLSYMELHHNAKIEKKVKEEKWLMPHIMPGCPVDYGKGKILFAGETAGFLNPMGEGISAGLESGYAAAQAIQQVDLNSSAWDIETVYSAYKYNTQELKTYMERQWRFVASMSATFEYMK